MVEIWKYGEYSKTAGLFLYFLNLKFNHIAAYGFKIKNAYLSDHGNEKDYGCECVYVVLESMSVSADEIGVLKVFERRPDTLLDSYMLDKDLVVVVKIPENLLPVLKHFRNGEYSKIGKNLASEHFALFDPRYNVIMRTPELKKVIEDMLGVELPKDAELADAPNPLREILRFDPEKFEKEKHLWKVQSVVYNNIL